MSAPRTRLVHRTGPLEEFLTGPVPDDLRAPGAWLFRPERPALVLGSSQRESLADHGAAAAAGVEVVRRRSGGGAVHVDPDRCLWLDVVVPPADERWSDDVREATYWLGEAWQRALQRVGVRTSLHRGGVEVTPWGRLVCFGALGPGEVVQNGRKVVGVSQRRTRAGARFQCLVYAEWRPRDVLDLLDLEDGDRERAHADLAGRAVGVGDDRLPALRDAILDELHAT